MNMALNADKTSLPQRTLCTVEPPIKDALNKGHDGKTTTHTI